MTLYYDSMMTLAYAKNPKYHGKTKHIEIRYHFIKDMTMQNEVILKHIHTNEMFVDPFTKFITVNAFARHINPWAYVVHEIVYVTQTTYNSFVIK